MSEPEKMQALPAIIWEKRYEVGHPILDAQHRHLIDLINALHSAAQGEGLMTVDAVLPHFVRFLQDHFETEEAILRQVAYSGVERHANEHRALTRQVADAIESAQDSQTADPVRFAAAIWSRLHYHTMTWDQEYAPLLRSLSRPKTGEPSA
jgi:hemerythrin